MSRGLAAGVLDARRGTVGSREGARSTHSGAGTLERMVTPEGKVCVLLICVPGAAGTGPGLAPSLSPSQDGPNRIVLAHLCVHL